MECLIWRIFLILHVSVARNDITGAAIHHKQSVGGFDRTNEKGDNINKTNDKCDYHQKFYYKVSFTIVALTDVVKTTYYSILK